MTVRRWWVPLWMSLVLLPACGERNLGAGGDGGLPGPDADTRPDGAVWPDGGETATVYGTVRLVHERQAGEWIYEEATLSAFFYEVDYVPPEPVDPGFVERRVTPDGVECDLFFTAPDWGGDPPSPDPPEPAPINAGEISITGTGDNGDALVTRWDGTGYVPDRRYLSANGGDWPGWLEPAALRVVIEGDGSGQAAPFTDLLALVDVPDLVEPGPDETLSPNLNGEFFLMWTAAPDTSVEVRLDMNMDWDNAVFRCYPQHLSMILPQAWMNDYSWGWAEVRVIARQDHRELLGSTVLLVQARRSTHQSNEFEIEW